MTQEQIRVPTCLQINKRSSTLEDRWTGRPHFEVWVWVKSIMGSLTHLLKKSPDGNLTLSVTQNCNFNQNKGRHKLTPRHLQLQQCSTGKSWRRNQVEVEVEVGQMHSGCVAKSCRELLPSDSGHAAVGHWAKGRWLLAEQALSTPVFSPTLVEEPHFKKPSTFVSVEVTLVALHGAKQTQYGAQWRVHGTLNLPSNDRTIWALHLWSSVHQPPRLVFTRDTVK